MLVVARFALAAIFIGAGFVKVTKLCHALVPEVHEQMAKDFGKFLRVAPFTKFFRPTSVQYMHIVGYTELLAGMMLLSNTFPRLVSFVLAAIMAGAIYTLYLLNEPMEKIAVPLVLMVIALLVAHGSKEHSKEKKE